LTDRSVNNCMSPRTPLQNEQIRAESKHKIMDAAFTLIAQNGYESTSIAMIAKTAGVSKGLLYNYFTSKEELVKALVFGAMAEGDRLIAQLICDDPRQTLENMFLWFFNEMRENHDHWRLMTELTFKINKFDFVHDIATTKLQEFVVLLQGLLTEMGYNNALQEARIIAALLDGIGFQAIMVQEDYPLDEMQEYLIMKYCHEH
jgi:AcrR family transcriptional regulator